MITFIIRRLIVTVFLLLVVSLITFAIFFLVPRLAGQNNYELAVQYVGRNPTPSAVHAIERKLGFDQPIFFTGLIALELFSYKWEIFPNVQYVALTQNPLQWARNLVLPWITLAFLYAALYARLTRAGMLETMNEDYIRTARAKGLGEGKVIVKHGLRAALTPIVTIFGIDLGLLLGGAAR